MKTSLHRSALVMHPVVAMYQLVNDIESYPAFMKGCSGAEILEQGEGYMVARLDLKAKGVTCSFVTRNTLEQEKRIVLNLEQGPFRSLTGEWTFKALAENACKVSLELSFEFLSAPVALASSSLFAGVANNLVDAVVARAGKIYGSPMENT